MSSSSLTPPTAEEMAAVLAELVLVKAENAQLKDQLSDARATNRASETMVPAGGAVADGDELAGGAEQATTPLGERDSSATGSRTVSPLIAAHHRFSLGWVSWWACISVERGQGADLTGFGSCLDLAAQLVPSERTRTLPEHLVYLIFRLAPWSTLPAWAGTSFEYLKLVMRAQ